MGPLQGMGPNKSTEREVERRKEFGAQDRVCCSVLYNYAKDNSNHTISI